MAILLFGCQSTAVAMGEVATVLYAKSTAKNALTKIAHCNLTFFMIIHTIRKLSFSVQRRNRLKLRQVVMPSPVGLAMVNEV